MSVAIVSDSTGYLTAELRPDGLTLVPVAVIIDGTAHDETDIPVSEVSAALRRRTAVSTSRPAPAKFAAAYESLAQQGYDEIVSIHLSGELSGTVDDARIAARTSPIPVTVVDSRTVAAALGFAVRSAAQAAAQGGSAQAVAEAAQRRAEQSRTWIVVDKLDQLRRLGRIGTAEALAGTALMVKPILVIEGGMISPVAKLRTQSRALARMAELVCECAGDQAADVIVQHCAAPDRAREQAAILREALPNAQVHVLEVGAVISAHVGLGTVSVAVCPR